MAAEVADTLGDREPVIRQRLLRIVVDISEPHPVWRQVLVSLAGVLTPGNFARCTTAHVIEQADTILRIAVPSVFEQQWWMRQMGRHVQEALADCGYGGLQAVFLVETTGDLAS